MRYASMLGFTFVLSCLVGCQTIPTTSGPVELYVTQRGKAGMTFKPQSGGENTVDSVFAGKHRAGPKTSTDDSEVEAEYASLTALFETLPSDQDMQEQFESLVEETGDPKAKYSEVRLPDEQRNVRVQAWLYAVKSEDDMDFHVIIGSSRHKSEAEFMNVEASGLPKNPQSADKHVLRNVRQQLETMLAGNLPGSKYAKLKKPIAVEVEGTLFYDIDHEPGVVGPMGMRPETSWEIHPITDLQQGHD
jgi:hypothetical protein